MFRISEGIMIEIYCTQNVPDGDSKYRTMSCRVTCCLSRANVCSWSRNVARS
jgi:hypothetical protein